jgi:HemY protein
VHLRSGDSARDRMARARELVRLAPGHREGALALARAAIDAREFATARGALEPLLRQPTQRVAMLMAELEEAEHEDSGRAREWMSRALRMRGDPRWTADGMVSERWLPVSPVSGRVDAFVWATPSSEIAAIAPIEPDRNPARPTPALPVPASEHNDSPAPASAVVVEPAVASAQAAPPSAPPPPKPAAPAPAAAVAPPPPQRTAPPAPRRDAIIPLTHAPDDPGPEPEPEPDARTAGGPVKRF